MRIEVIGNCCASCHTTYHAFAQAAIEIDINITVVHIENVVEILRMGVVQMPTVRIDGTTISSGVHYSVDKAKEIILKLKMGKIV